MTTDKKFFQCPRLDDWQLGFPQNHEYDDDDDFPPFMVKSNSLYLIGTIKNHPDFEDDTFCRTSPISKLDVTNNIAEVTGGLYVFLGDPDPRFVEWLDNMGMAIDDFSMDGSILN